MAMERMGDTSEHGVVQNGIPHSQRVMAWLGKAEDIDNVTDDVLRTSDEFPRLDLILATELFNNAKAGCPELAIRMRGIKETRMTNRSIVTGRELCRLYVVYFKSNVDADATYQWLDLAKVQCEPGK